MNRSDNTGHRRTSSNRYTEIDRELLKWVDELSKDDILHQDFLATKEQDEMIEELNNELALQVQKQLLEDELTVTTRSPQEKEKNIAKRFKIVASILALFLLISYITVLTPVGENLLVKIASTLFYNKITLADGAEEVLQEVEDEVISNIHKYTDKELEDAVVEWDFSHTSDGARQEEGVTNILILGEEAIEAGGGRGRTDLMMIATLNANSKTVKLTSLMRDMLVRIEGFKDNKLNSAYTTGGVQLLYQTVETNFDIKLDGYMLVGFSDFEEIINKLGGVQITLTDGEAKYLQTTNYIADPNHRDVVSGVNNLNGGQALGYVRIRDIKTSDNQTDDYGRTSRQRVLLNAIFEKYKSKNIAELLFLMNDILPLIKTDINKQDFENYLKSVLTMGIPSIETMRIPVKNGFDTGFVRKMDVLIPDVQKNIDALHQFIFE